MLTPSSFRWVQESHPVRPAIPFGAAVTPVQNTKGAWVEVMPAASMTQDGWHIVVRANDGDTSTFSRDLIMDIGIDTGGGFVVLIPDLLVSYAGIYTNANSPAIEYAFPLHIPANARIGARVSSSSTTLTPVYTSVIVSGDPSIPQGVYKGSFVRAFTANPAVSAGTPVVSGTTGEGAWTELGTLAEDIYYWQVGWGADDSTLNSAIYHIDIGLGATSPPTLLALSSVKNLTGAAEQVARGAGYPAWVTGTTGQKVYGRLQYSGGTPDTNTTLIAYGVGGNGGNSDYPSYSDGYTAGYAAGYAQGIIDGGGGGGPPVFPAIAGVTTAPAICAELIAAIRVLAPVSLSQNGFVPHQEQKDFVEWATSAGSAQLRRFSVRFNEGGMPIVSGYNYEVRRDPFTISVAYPTSWRAGDSLLDMQRIIDQDRHAIEHACGWRAGFATFTVTDDDYDAEYRKVGDTTFLELTFTYEYTRSMA